jgi:hypothetical protein
MKKEDKILSYEQARELKWFCKNVAGVREDYYDVMSSANSFDVRLKRLELTCDMIGKFLGEHLTPHEKANWGIPDGVDERNNSGTI